MAKDLTTSGYSFYTSAEYWSTLIARIKQTKAGERIAVMTMDFDPSEPIIEEMLEALLQATKRGVSVRLCVDARPFLFDPGTQRLGPLWHRQRLTRLSGVFKQRLSALQTIDSQEIGQAVIINKPTHRFSNPFAGRSHIKMAIITNEVFLGSCNLNGTGALNLMVAKQSKEMADYLFHFVQDIIQSGHVGRMLNWHDQQRVLSSTTTLFIDAGKPKQSIIFEQALRLIDEAKEKITLTCQFFPGGITAQHLLKARERGVQINIIYAHPDRHRGLYGLGQHYNVWRERQRMPKEFFEAGLDKDVPLMHVKLLVTDAGSMFGSHNYVHAGVRLGTAEIALRSSDLAFGQAALDALRQELGHYP